MTKVGVVIPCYNAGAFLGQALDSLKAQSLTDWTAVVVDDGSDDDSLAVAKRYEDAKIRVISQPNGGASKARNAGYRALPDTEYVYFLDADDIMEPLMLGVLVASLDDETEAGAIYGQYRAIDETNAETGEVLDFGLYDSWYGIPYKTNRREVPFYSLMAWFMAIPSTTLIRRSVYDKTQGWNEAVGFRFCEDNDMLLSLSLQAPVHFFPSTLLSYRHHPGSFSSRETSRKRGLAELETKWKKHKRGRKAIAFSRRMWTLRHFQYSFKAWRKRDRRRAFLEAGRGVRSALAAVWLAIPL